MVCHLGNLETDDEDSNRHLTMQAHDKFLGLSWSCGARYLLVTTFVARLINEAHVLLGVVRFGKCYPKLMGRYLLFFSDKSSLIFHIFGIDRQICFGI